VPKAGDADVTGEPGMVRHSAIGMTSQGKAPGGLSLRILATTDMHMHVLPYDYLSDRPSNRIGLARVASLAMRRQQEVRNSLLLDNGDFLQGNPLGDYAAGKASCGARHPAIAA